MDYNSFHKAETNYSFKEKLKAYCTTSEIQTDVFDRSVFNELSDRLDMSCKKTPQS